MPTQLNVKDYGAFGDGVTDDTAAINAAVAAQSAGIRAGAPVYFPPGVYIYTGPGFDIATPWFVGAGWSSTYIDITGTDYFIDSNQLWSSLWVSGILFYGGTGAIRNRYTASNVTGTMVVRDNNFNAYTGAAVTDNTVDGPYWKIHGNIFNAADASTTSIGVALTGLTDATSILDNSFLRNQIHVKIGHGGNNAYVRNNDFIQFSNTGTARTSVWMVPTATSTNSGAGFVCNSNKFGNESYESTDYKILFADEGTGATFGERLPTVAADSTGYLTGLTFSENHYQFSGAGGPLIYSTTPNIGGLKVDGFTAGGMTEVIKFRTPPAGLAQDLPTNLIGPIRVGDENSAPPPVSLLTGGVGRVLDPTEVFEADHNTAHAVPGGAAGTGFAKLTTATVPTWSLANATASAVTDAVGGTDAVRVTGGAGGGEIYNLLASAKLRYGAPMWVELDLRRVSGSAVTSITAAIKTYDNITWSMRRVMNMPALAAGWQRYRFLAYPRSTANTMIADIFASTGGAFDLGRVRIYHAREPMPVDLVLPDTVTTTTAPIAGGAGALPATPAGYMTVYINGTPRKLPYY